MHQCIIFVRIQLLLIRAVVKDPRQRKPDITTAKEQIGWEPKVPVKEGLAKAIEYFRKELKESGEIIPTGPIASKPQQRHKVKQQGVGKE